MQAPESLAIFPYNGVNVFRRTVVHDDHFVIGELLARTDSRASRSRSLRLYVGMMTLKNGTAVVN